MKKIVVIGPESTGKSALCEQLAARFHTTWVPEYAREHLLKHGTAYTYDDLLTIAKQQIALEDRIANQTSSELLFVDTDMYVMKVWSEFVFNRCHQWILDTIVGRQYDMYLLCNTDLEWVKDELREYPDLETRRKLFFMYKDILVNQHVPWKEISGTNHQRTDAAERAVKKLLDHSSNF
jgi:NadR type nicotinamide-nucleotide adenylyltransferase